MTHLFRQCDAPPPERREPGRALRLGRRARARMNFPDRVSHELLRRRVAVSKIPITMIGVTAGTVLILKRGIFVRSFVLSVPRLWLY